ncbi:chalcone isomerase family protein [Schlesneria paludicola]|uniref:chalcone isomerase family protein n=1 Tax=Schlesneria paludicola TaxID=360056 RepID=UPI00029ACB4B|nr:chalcone isomerase family protein [Schlesneria paludicola]
MNARQAIAGILILFLISGPMISAAEIEGVTFPDNRHIGKTKLVLNNVGLMRYNIVIKAMVAGLYLGEGIEPKQALADVPKRIEIHYFWNLKGTDIVDASEKLLVANATSERIQKVRGQIDQMHKLYENIKAGDRYSLTYIPSVGTELALNGEPKGLVKGADFAKVYFSIWLGKKPMDIALRDQLVKPRS